MSIEIIFIVILLGVSRDVFGCVNGQFSPHPTDCNKYLLCNNGREVVMSCNTGLWWNNVGKYCDYPKHSGCTPGGVGSTTTSPSNPSTTSVSPPPPQPSPPSPPSPSPNPGGRTERGICSYYGDEGEIPPGWPTACGQPFDRMSMTAATWPDVPCGTKLRVTDLDTGKFVDVTVDDRFGDAPKDRIVDLTYGAFAHLAPHSQGLIKNCQYQYIS